MTGIIIQSRLGSTRLPRKAFLLLGNKTVIEWVVNRCLETRLPVVLAVPAGEEEEYKQCLETVMAYNSRFWIYGGHPTDVLDRYYEVAKAFQFDPIVRITGDCPLIESKMVEDMVYCFEGGYLSNCHPIRTVPEGLDVEIFDFENLEWAFKKGTGNQREHVTKYFYTEIPEICTTYSPPFDPKWKMCIDTQEDYERIKAMIEEGKYPWQN